MADNLDDELADLLIRIRAAKSDSAFKVIASYSAGACEVRSLPPDADPTRATLDLCLERPSQDERNRAPFTFARSLRMAWLAKDPAAMDALRVQARAMNASPRVLVEVDFGPPAAVLAAAEIREPRDESGGPSALSPLKTLSISDLIASIRSRTHSRVAETLRLDTPHRPAAPTPEVLGDPLACVRDVLAAREAVEIVRTVARTLTAAKKSRVARVVAENAYFLLTVPRSCERVARREKVDPSELRKEWRALEGPLRAQLREMLG